MLSGRVQEDMRTPSNLSWIDRFGPLDEKEEAETLCVQEHFEGVLGWLQPLRHVAEHKIQHKARNNSCMELRSGSLLDSSVTFPMSAQYAC